MAPEAYWISRRTPSHFFCSSSYLGTDRQSYGEESVSSPSLQLLSIVVGALVNSVMSHTHYLATGHLWELDGDGQPWCALVCSAGLGDVDISTWSHREVWIFPLGNRLMAPRLNIHGEGQQVPAEGALEPQM